MNSQKPIGVFDSGIGGLTVTRAIAKLLPNERIVYFGDTAHFPYGDKERSSVKKYCETIADFLLKKECKAIVIACNTASSACTSSLKKHLPPDFPLLNVIYPVVEHIKLEHAKKNIGIIATKGTIASRIYPKLIKNAIPDAKVNSVATPLLAPMIEEGFYNNNISKSVIAAYLSKKNISKIACLILGCTHYPIIESEIKAYYQSTGQKTDIINSAKIVADHVKKTLTKLKLLSDQKTKAHEFYVSDYTASFEQSSELFFGEKVKLTKVQLWK